MAYLGGKFNKSWTTIRDWLFSSKWAFVLYLGLPGLTAHFHGPLTSSHRNIGWREYGKQPKAIELTPFLVGKLTSSAVWNTEKTSVSESSLGCTRFCSWNSCIKGKKWTQWEGLALATASSKANCFMFKSWVLGYHQSVTWGTQGLRVWNR